MRQVIKSRIAGRMVAKPQIEVHMPGPFSTTRAALSSCAIEGNQFAIDALETIRRVEAGEPIGLRYAEALNGFVQQHEC